MRTRLLSLVTGKSQCVYSYAGVGEQCGLMTWENLVRHRKDQPEKLEPNTGEANTPSLLSTHNQKPCSVYIYNYIYPPLQTVPPRRVYVTGSRFFPF